MSHKQLYILEKGHELPNSEKLFNIFSEDEERLGKDLCEFTSEEAISAFSKVPVVRAHTIKVRVSMLRDYVEWCQKNTKLKVNTDLLTLKIDADSGLKKVFVESPEQLQQYLDVICEPEDKLQVDNTYRCVYWFAFMGINRDDVINITKENVLLDSRKVIVNGKEFPIYEEAVKAISNCVNLDYFNHPVPGGNVKKMPRDEKSRIIRGFKGDPSILTIQTELSHRSERAIREGKTTLRLSYIRVMFSGIFYRLYQLEQAGAEANFKQAALDFSEGRAYRYNKYRKRFEQMVLVNQRNLEEDYRRWKKAYNK